MSRFWGNHYDREAEKARHIEAIAKGLDNAETTIELLNLLADPEFGSAEMAIKQMFDTPRKRLLRFIAKKIYEAREEEALAGISKGSFASEEEQFSNFFERKGQKSPAPKREINWSKPPETEEEYLERIPTSVDMMEEEGLGGHAVERHATESRGMTRIRNKGVSPSSFYDGLREQNAITSKIIYRRRHEIARRLANGEGDKMPFAINFKSKKFAGEILKYNKTGSIKKDVTRQIRLIIRKDPNNPKGWRVQSSFPVKENPKLPFED